MKPTLTLFLLLLMVGGCRNISEDELQGRWSTMVEDQYCELWFSKGYVLDWNAILGDIRLRKYELDGNVIYFYEPLDIETMTEFDTIKVVRYKGYPANMEFALKVKKIEADGIITINPIHPEHPKHVFRKLDDLVFDLTTLKSSEKYNEVQEELLERSRLNYTP